MTFAELGVLRVIVPLLMIRFPLIGILAAEALDNSDWKLLALREESDYRYYQYWDKFLDSYYLSLAFAAALRWEDRVAKGLAAATYVLRMVGVALFFATGQRWLLFLFPNIFEGVFVFMEAFLLLTAGEALLFATRMRSAWVVAVVAVPRLAREYFIHVSREWPWDAVTLIGESADHMLWQAAYLAPSVTALIVLVAREKRHLSKLE